MTERLVAANQWILAITQQQERQRCAAMLDISRSEACLMAGELTAQEWRTVAAILAALKVGMLRDG